MGSMVIDKAFVGSSEVDKIYLGTELVWQAQRGIPIDGAPNGVYILRTDNLLYKQGAWNTDWNTEVVGITLISNEQKFVIAPSETSSKQWSKNGAHDEISGVTTESSLSPAKQDYKGESNSDSIFSYYGNSTDYAAGYSENYAFKNGKNGYLGSFGEWVEAYNNKSEIDSCISLIGLTPISIDSDYWTSTQINANNAWRFGWETGRGSTTAKGQNYRVRPFAPLT